MSFFHIYTEYKNLDFEKYLDQVTEEDVIRIIKKKIGPDDFLNLLSPAAEGCLEQMAQRARQLSLQHFGKAVLLYTPMYIANYCVNKCAYCGFNVANKINRKQLSMDEIEAEAKAIAQTGLRHILVLTGESKAKTPVSYIVEAVKVLKKHFDSITIEIYPLTEKEYAKVIAAGVDGLTIYQEVYDQKIYDKVHLAGPKKDYKFRLDAPERASAAKIRNINIGALLGLSNWKKEAFFAGIHAQYLQNRYTDVEVGLSLPRIRPHLGIFSDIIPVTDRNLVQIMLAFRLLLPYASINLSTRENKNFRDHLIPLGVNKLSAGVSTEVGGHSKSSKGDGQFDISDTRSVAEIKESLIGKGYQPIFKDWMNI